MTDTSTEQLRLDRRLAWALFLVTLGVWLLGSSRERPWGDAEIMFRVSEAIVERASFEIEYLWPPMSHRGADGRIYAQYALLPSLQHLPGALLLELGGPRHRGLLWPVAGQLGPSLAGAVACAMWFQLARALGVRRSCSVVGAFTVAFATMLCVYARRPFSESLQVATFVGFSLALLRFVRTPSRRSALMVGIAAGLLVNAKLLFALSVGAGLAIALVQAPETRRQLGWVIAGGVPFAGMLLAYNAARWGHPLDTGYDATLALAKESMFWGLFGLLLSPGKSVLLYNPLLLLVPSAWRRYARACPRETWLLAGLVLPPMLYCARFLNWGGGWCWGPRYWMFAVPVLLLPVCWWLDQLTRERERDNKTRLVVLLAATLALSGACINTAGNAFYWDAYIRIARRTQTKWLGRPDRSGAVIDEAGRGHCDSCIEDTYALLWLPQFSPVVGHTWLLRHVPLQHDWATAQVDAPWRRHTALEVDIPHTYKRAKLDWWPLTWQDNDARVGVGFMVGFAIPVALGLFLLAWVRAREQ